MANPSVVQFEITGQNSATLQRFYARLFGWPMRETGSSDYARVLAREAGI